MSLNIIENPMRRRPGSRAIAALALSVQLTVAILGTVGLCLERAHTHAGVPAPDCLMHHTASPDVPGEPAQHHHHHSPDTTPPTGTTSIGCSCAGDALLLLLAPAAVLAEPSRLTTPGVAVADLPPVTERLVELHAAPLSPPPRASLS